MRRLFRDLSSVALAKGGRAFSFIAILTLGLGIGANTAIFSLVQTVLIRPLPYGDPDRIAIVWDPATPFGGSEATWLSRQEVFAYKRESQLLADIGTYTTVDINLTGGQEPERVRAAAITPNLFSVLRVAPSHGRVFTEDEGRVGQGSRAIVISDALWRRRFGGDPAVVGREIQVNGRTRAIVGIMPASFRVPADFIVERQVEAWVPLEIDPANLGGWGDRSYFGVTRLKDGVTPAAIESEFRVIADRWVRAGFVHAKPDGSLGMLARTAVPVTQFVSGASQGPLLILLGSALFVLLIACANVANLQLARADVRRREVAVRAALGAGRAAIIRQLLGLSVTLAAIGGRAVLGVAWAGLRLVVAMRPANLPRVDEVHLDGSMLAVTAMLALFTGVVFGLVPALQLSKPDVAGVLKDGGRGGTAGKSRQWIRQGLVVLQLSSSVVLALAAGLLIRSLVELTRIDLGFTSKNVLTAQLQLSAATYADPASVVRFYQQLLDRVSHLPGVKSAGAVRILPLAREIGDWSIKIEGRPYVVEENPNGDFQTATPGYFETMGIRLVRGRFITAEDRADSPLSVVINDTMANRYWPGEDAIGKRFVMGTLDTTPWLTIVGIVSTVRHNAIVEAPRAEMYIPHAQLAREIGGATRALTVVIKTEGDPMSSAGGLRDAVRSLDANLPISDIRSMDTVVAGALAQPRFLTILLGLFALLALALAAIGIYGTISLIVAERTPEMGIRLALGADRSTILRMILRQGLALTVVGLGVGVIGAMFLARLLATLVYGVQTLDPLTFASVPLLLAVVSLLACLVPAYRASAVDPVLTLRG